MLKRKTSMEHSIRFRFISIFILIIIIMIISFFVSFSRQNMIKQRYDRFMMNNKNLSEIPLKVDQLGYCFNNYLKGDKNALDQYFLLNKQIDEILTSIRPDIKDDDTLIFYRSVSNMHDYQQNLADDLVSRPGLNFHSYQDISYLNHLYMYMNRQSQLLSLTYLDYSTLEYANLLERAKQVDRGIYILVIVFGFVSIIFASIFSKDIFETIDNLSAAAKLLSAACWDIPDIKVGKYRELNSVANAFNNMKKNIKEYINELSKKAEIEIQLNKEKLRNAEKDRLLKESQLLALQMQMNPHFLFNTLNIIGRTALLEDNGSTIRLIEAISEILRYNLENKGKSVPLETEISALKAYIYIQNMRFQERMSFDLNIAANIEDVYVPTMILQPVVENAIIHGLKDKVKGGKVDISVLEDNQYLYIIINDNGQGIDEIKLRSIFNNGDREKPAGQRSSVGLANVKNRLELYFNRQNLLEVVSKPGMGTTVKILIPLKGELDDHKTDDC